MAFALPAPGKYDPAMGNDLDVLAAGDVLAGDVDSVDATGARVESGVDAFPLHHFDRIDEKLEDDRLLGGDSYLPLDEVRCFRSVHC